MYGLNLSKAREQLHILKKDDNESYLCLGNRVERLVRLAYSGMKPNTERRKAVDHFDRAISNCDSRWHLLVVIPKTLTEAVLAAKKDAKMLKHIASVRSCCTILTLGAYQLQN